MVQAQPPGLQEVIGGVAAEDVQGPLHAGSGGDRGASRPAQVGVVEIRQPVGGGAHLTAQPPFLPGEHALVRTQPGQHRADRIAVADDHPVGVAHLAGLRRHAQPPADAH